MLNPSEVLHIVEWVLEVCGGAFAALAEHPSTVRYVVYATVAIRLAVALVQLIWWLVRVVRRLLRWQRQRAEARQQIAAAVSPRLAQTPMDRASAHGDRLTETDGRSRDKTRAP